MVSFWNMSVSACICGCRDRLYSLATVGQPIGDVRSRNLSLSKFHSPHLPFVKKDLLQFSKSYLDKYCR